MTIISDLRLSDLPEDILYAVISLLDPLTILRVRQVKMECDCVVSAF